MTTVHPTTTYTLSRFDGDDANGVATILSTLVEQNLENHPERLDLARKFNRPVAVFSTDTNTAATIVFRRDHATVCNDIVNDPPSSCGRQLDRFSTSPNWK